MADDISAPHISVPAPAADDPEIRIPELVRKPLMRSR